MINSFEFISAKTWCRLAADPSDLISNPNTYLDLFADDVYKSRLSLSPTVDNQSISTVVSSNSGLKISELSDGDLIVGSILAHLENVIVKDSSLLVLVDDGLSITEGYGDQRWANYQITTWPGIHNYPLCAIGVEDLRSMGVKMRLKVYSIQTTIRHLPLSAIYLSVRSQDNNIYHWILEATTRLKCLELIPELRELPIIIRDPLSDFQKTVLELLGVKNKFIITNGESFRVDHLFFPSIPAPPYLHRQSMLWLREKILNGLGSVQKQKKGRRIYISRHDSNRRISNEEEIRRVLIDLDFEILLLSSIKPVDQMNIFREAEIIVMPHGACY
jgi:hypothetical protein